MVCVWLTIVKGEGIAVLDSFVYLIHGGKVKMLLFSPAPVRHKINK